MNEVINKFFLGGDKCMPEMHLRQPGLTYFFMDLSIKPKNEYKNSKKQNIHNIFIKGKEIKLVFNMIWRF